MPRDFTLKMVASVALAYPLFCVVRFAFHERRPEIAIVVFSLFVAISCVWIPRRAMISGAIVALFPVALYAGFLLGIVPKLGVIILFPVAVWALCARTILNHLPKKGANQTPEPMRT